MKYDIILHNLHKAYLKVAQCTLGKAMF